MKFKVTIEQDEDGKFVAQCPSLPGCISEGTNREEVLANIKDAIEGYLASLNKHNEPIPPSIEEETVEVSAQAAGWELDHQTGTRGLPLNFWRFCSF